MALLNKTEDEKRNEFVTHMMVVGFLISLGSLAVLVLGVGVHFGWAMAAIVGGAIGVVSGIAVFATGLHSRVVLG